MSHNSQIDRRIEGAIRNKSMLSIKGQFLPPVNPFTPSEMLWDLEQLSLLVHDDVIKWKQFPRYWPFVRGIHRSPVNSPHKGQWRRPLMFSFICARINGWVNNREAGDLRRHPTHWDVIVMYAMGLCNRSSKCRIYPKIRAHSFVMRSLYHPFLWIRELHLTSGLFYWRRGNLTIAPVPVKLHWTTWVPNH